MPELDFKRKVQQIPAGESLPAPFQRSVEAQVSNVPNYQSVIGNYAASSNWMSSLGSQVASKASNSLATTLGGEMGKNPQGGEFSLGLTDFDKAFNESYKAQSQATLGLQAQQLITNSNLELAAMPRLDEGTINKANNNVKQGLAKIFSYAPSSVRANLENHYGSVMIEQNAQLTKRLIKEQTEDRINTTVAALKSNTQDTYSLALNGLDIDKEGDSKSGLQVLKTVEQISKSAVEIRDLTPQQAQVSIDAARQSYLSGKYIRLALSADKERKLPEFLRNLADNLPKDIGAQDHDSVYRNVLSYFNTQNALKAQDQNLKNQVMATRVATEPENISAMEWSEYENSVSPYAAAQMEFKFKQGLAKKLQSNAEETYLQKNYSNPTAQANSSTKIKNAVFNKNVQKLMDKDSTLSRDDAEVMVAMSAGAPVPVFIETLQNKLSSSNYEQAYSAVQQIHKLQALENGQALKGLTTQDLSMVTAIASQRDPIDRAKAIQDAHHRIYNQDQRVSDTIKANWAKTLSRTNSANIPNNEFALKTFGMNKGNFLDASIALTYGAQILSQFEDFYFNSGGDYDEAKKSTQTWVDANYGDTYINGGKFKTLNPIEKVVGIESRDGVQYIQENIANQISEKIAPLKTEYDEKRINEYWEMLPIEIKSRKYEGIFKPNSRDVSVYVSDSEAIPTLPERTSPDFLTPGKVKVQDTIAGAISAQNKYDYEQYQQHLNEASRETTDFFRQRFEPIKIKRHMRTAVGEKVDVFNVILLANTFGDYDVSIQTQTGRRNLFQEAPFLGIVSVAPNVDQIRANYLKEHM